MVPGINLVYLQLPMCPWGNIRIGIIAREALEQQRNNFYLVTFQKSTSVAWVPLVQPKNRHYLVISSKLISVALQTLLKNLESS